MSEVKVNKISPRSGTEVTLGDSGDTFTIPSGATINNQGTATNFGATGSASWVTTPKTGDFTAVAGEGYFVDTSSGEIDVTLPAGTAGAVIAISDYAKNFATNNCILLRNGSDKVGGSAVNPTLSTNGVAVTLVFVDSTKGWIVTDSGNQNEAPTATFITATGGTITTVCTNFKVHTFTGPGTFTVCSVGNAQGSNEVSYMVVAGGGGGGNARAGGGGAGGFREGKTPQCTYTQSPIACTSGSNNGIPVTAQGYPIVVGGGGPGGAPPGSSPGTVGVNSSAFGITSAGGGFGGSGKPNRDGGNGGSGGGGGSGNCAGGAAGTGNSPSVTPAQGFNGGLASSGGSGPNRRGGGGGGATAIGTNGVDGNPTGGAGGAGATTSINGAATAFAGGGGGGVCTCEGGPGGAGGGGTGGKDNATATNGTTNTGGGAGGGGRECAPGVNGAVGGSGIVIIRYKFQ
jgi:hypothetical protein